MSQYIDRDEAAKSYRPVAGSMSPGLKRAREPYRLKNALLGLTLAAFAVGVWAYSISAVKQDVFDDVDEEAEALGSTGTGTGFGVGILAAGKAQAAKEKAQEVEKAKVVATEKESLIPKTTAAPPTTPVPVKDSLILQEVSKVEAKAHAARGVLPPLEQRLPWLLDPERKTLVWGAPPVDNIGKMSKSS